MADQKTDTKPEPKNEPTPEPEPTPKPEPEPKPEPQGGDDVKDSHGQPGINKERHDKEVAELNEKISTLEAQLAEASEQKSKREEYEKQINELKAQIEDGNLVHSLELAGCIDVKSAKARLEDFGGDVAKLKEGCPHLFGNTQQKQKGSTGKPPAGAADAIEAKLDKAFGL